ncbi:TBC1 domain family member 15 [Nymphaea thermarum]|nr:TBC1 domain family member 15 [Nymphaea thermarum]
MQEAESHDLSDDSDYAALQEQQSSMNNQQTNDDLGDPNGAELVYLKDNVTIHPTQYASDRISGRLRLIKRGSSLFMTWIPYKLSTSGLPSIKQGSSTRKLEKGVAYPNLYFYNGGVREFLGALKQHVFLARSADDANVFLVNDFQDPLQRSLSSLELPRIVTVTKGASALNLGNSVEHAKDTTSLGSNEGNVFTSEDTRVLHQKNRDPARDLSIQVLEKFSLVTKFARDTTSHLFRESQFLDGGDYQRPQLNQPTLVTTSVAPSGTGNLAEDPTVYDDLTLNSEPSDINELSLVWGKPRLPPLGSEEWMTFLDSEGRIVDSKALRKRIFYGGMEKNLRKEVWKLLLGYHEYDSTYAEREYLAAMKKSEYEKIKGQWQSISPAQAKRFTKYRERKSLIEKDVVRTDRTISFYDGDDNPNVSLLRDILLTYSFYNFDLGYCQGMSDFLSPILYIMEDESESFWCFVALMDRFGPNFNRDQNGMHSQLLALLKLVELLDGPLHSYLKQADCLNYFFCFRWILIQFKREFEYEETMRLWEVLWTHYLSEHFHLYICVAILKRYRKKIVDEQMDFDTLLKFINELSCHINLERTLKDAEALCICAGENGAACIPPGTPPSLPVEKRLVCGTGLGMSKSLSPSVSMS